MAGRVGKAGGLRLCGGSDPAVAAATPAASRRGSCRRRAEHPPARRVGYRGVHTTDQAKLYDALTPLGGNVTAKTLTRLFKPETLGPSGKIEAGDDPAGGREDPPRSLGRRPRLRQDLRRREWGAGWVTGEDRGLDPAADPRPGPCRRDRRPGVRSEPRVRPQRADRGGARCAVQAAPEPGREGAPADRADRRLHRGSERLPQGKRSGASPWTRNDVVAAAAVLASAYGVGGGDEARRAEFLGELQVWLGQQRDAACGTTCASSRTRRRRSPRREALLRPQHERVRQRRPRRRQRRAARSSARPRPHQARQQSMSNALDRLREALDDRPPDLRRRPAGRVLLPGLLPRDRPPRRRLRLARRVVSRPCPGS